MKKFIALLLAAIILPASAAVRYNSHTRMWEGNICANQYGWTYTNWQPIGSICAIRMNNGMLMQGIIVNQ